MRALCLGADMSYSARGMMLALGCIQALECNKNNCPTGITTHQPGLTAGLVVSDKRERIEAFHGETVKAVRELMAAAGYDSLVELNRTLIYRRVNMEHSARLDEIFPMLETGCLLNGSAPEYLQRPLSEASSTSFHPSSALQFS